MTINSEKLRAEFEAWYTAQYTSYIPRSGNGYSNLDTELAWQAYQAGQAAMQLQKPEANDLMLSAVIRMPFEMAMADPISRMQFYQRAQQALNELEAMQSQVKNDRTLFCDLKTDEEKSAFFLSGRGYETGVIAQVIQNDVAMVYHRCAEYKKELEALQHSCKEKSQDRDDSQWCADDVREFRCIGNAINRAATDLPENWGIRISLELGAGTVYLSAPDGTETMIDMSGETFSDQISAAIDHARRIEEEVNKCS